MAFPDLLDSFADFKRPDVATDDGALGYSDTTSSVLYLRVPVRFENVSRDQDQVIVAYDGKNVFPDYYLYLEYLSGIKEGDQVTNGSKTFEIKLIENWSEQEEYLRMALVQLDRGK